MSEVATRPIINSLTATKVMADAKANLVAVMKARQEEDDQPFEVQDDLPVSPVVPQASPEPRTEEPPPEPPAPEPQPADLEPKPDQDFAALLKEHEALKVKFNSLDKRFRALQSSVTKPQQDNARLREQIKELQVRLGEVEILEDGSPAPVAKPINPELVQRVREIAPEAADLIEAQDRRLNRVEAQATESIQRQNANLKSYVEGLILSRHPDLLTFYNKPEFRTWAGPENDDLLKYPWDYPEGAGSVIGLISAYKDEIGLAPTPPPPSTPPAVPAPQVPAVPQPARTGVNIPTQTFPTTQGTPGKKILSRTETEALQRELRSCTPKRAEAIAGILQEQMRLVVSSGR